eukprot:3481800-Lingulodinium_polyedra.AAC.1
MLRASAPPCSLKRRLKKLRKQRKTLRRMKQRQQDLTMRVLGNNTTPRMAPFLATPCRNGSIM